jgi:acetyl-CoA carboxylase biotin carboxylase subunit
MIGPLRYLRAPMFRKILIANRGEVAARVLRTARRLGIRTVMVASDADKDLSILKEADEVRDLGAVRAYLDADRLLAIAEETGASAIHPGWGFLSENATFAARCEASRITFIGPRSLSIRLMGDKAVARRTMRNLGLDPIPGSDGVLADASAAREAADAIGYPVLLKAVGGGGGRGLRLVRGADEIEDAFTSASAEAASAFKNPDLYIERFIEGGRHVEIQVLGDGELTIPLRERECSVQRRHQKLLEESPSPAIDRDTADEIGARAADACTRLCYRGAGTIEMLLDDAGDLWFMEMNTRLQVEHTVTEMLTGLDLVELQLCVAANEPLRVEPTFRGHAIQCRINAEDPAQNFKPTPGTVRRLRFPEGEGIRVDTHLREGDAVSPHYDSMIAKLIVHAESREAAIQKMVEALRSVEIEGVSTTIPLHAKVLADPRFRAGDYDTRLLEAIA